jgi:hypothetical protein
MLLSSFLVVTTQVHEALVQPVYTKGVHTLGFDISPALFFIANCFGDWGRSKHRQLEHTHIVNCFHMVASFIEAHEHAQQVVLPSPLSLVTPSLIFSPPSPHQVVPRFFGMGATMDTPEEVTIVRESVETVSKARAVLTALKQKHPIRVRAIQERQIALSVLEQQRAFINKLVEQGIVSSNESSALLEEVGEQTKFAENISVDKSVAEQNNNAAGFGYSSSYVDGRIRMSSGQRQPSSVQMLSRLDVDAAYTTGDNGTPVAETASLKPDHSML